MKFYGTILNLIPTPYLFTMSTRDSKLLYLSIMVQGINYNMIEINFADFHEHYFQFIINNYNYENIIPEDIIDNLYDIFKYQGYTNKKTFVNTINYNTKLYIVKDTSTDSIIYNDDIEFFILLIKILYYDKYISDYIVMEITNKELNINKYCKIGDIKIINDNDINIYCTNNLHSPVIKFLYNQYFNKWTIRRCNKKYKNLNIELRIIDEDEKIKNYLCQLINNIYKEYNTFSNDICIDTKLTSYNIKLPTIDDIITTSTSDINNREVNIDDLPVINFNDM